MSCSCVEGLQLKLRGLVGSGARDGPATEEEFKRLIDFIGAVPLFRKLPRSQYPLLAQRLRPRKWQVGERLIEVGEKTKQFTLIHSGTAKVELHVDGQTVAETLRQGDYFGEKCLEKGRESLSPARIVAEHQLVTLSISAKEFDSFGLRKNLRFPKRVAIGQLSESSHSGSTQPPKTEEQRQFISDSLHRNANLRSMVDLREEVVSQLVEAAEVHEVKQGVEVVHRGEWGGWFYIVYSGRFELRLDEPESLCRTASGPDRDLNGAATSLESMVSEMQQRRKRKERFLHVLIHSEELMGGNNPDSPTAHGRAWDDSMFSRGTSGPADCEREEESPKGKSTRGRRASSDYVGSDELSEIGATSTGRKHASPSSRRRRTTVVGDEVVSDVSRKSTLSTEGPRRFCGVQSMKTPKPRRSTVGDDADDLSPRRTVTTVESPLHNIAMQNNNGVLGVRTSGQSFGELALLYNVPRTSTAVAVEDSVAFRVSQAAFRRVMLNKQQRRQEVNVKILDKVELLQGLLSQEKRDMAQYFMTETFKPGSLVVREGERQDLWYILVEGECQMLRTLPDGTEEYLATLRPFKHFGERALLKGTASEFSMRVVSSEDVRCLVLAAPIFNSIAEALRSDPAFMHAIEDDLIHFAHFKGELDGPAKGILPRLQGPTRDATRIASARIASARIQLDPSAPVDHRALTRVATLGTGAYGVVTLERDPTTGQLFALKTLSKGLIVQNKLQDNVNNEREILGMVDSPFSISLLGTYKDSKNIYFLFEPLLGGDLHDHLHQDPAAFREPRTYKFMVGCMTLALEHLHARNIVFRDLKPENIILARDGYPRLCDYGFAKFVLYKAMTLCGTPEYVAPEVIGHSGYDRMVDWWALGVLTFEIITGYTPFCDEDDEEAPPVVIFYNIRRGIDLVKFPFKMPDVVSFIKSLCKANPTHRLGIGGASHVMGHHFFKELDLDSLRKLEPKAPYVPQVGEFRDCTDHELPPCPDYEEDNSGWDDNF